MIPDTAVKVRYARYSNLSRARAGRGPSRHASRAARELAAAVAMALLLVALAALAVRADHAPQTQSPTLQTRFLLLDRRVVERNCSCNTNVSLVLGQATKAGANPLVCEDRPWEVTWLNTDPDVWYDGGVWHLFYLSLLSCSSPAHPGSCPTKNYKYQPYVPSTTFNGAPLHSEITATLYANSSDGIQFVKPSMHLLEFNGSSANNIISPNVGGVMLDEADRNSSRKWKMFGSVPIPGAGNDGNSLDVWFSADGVHWRDPAFDSNASRAVLGKRKGGDTHNNLYRIGNERFGAVTRLDNFSSSNLRGVGLSTTADFQEYTPAKQVLLGATHNQTYGMQVVPWGGADLYIGSVAVYDDYGARAGYGKVYNELAVSYDGLSWERLLPGSVFVPHGLPGSFDSFTIYSAKPLRDPYDGSIRMYYSGGDGPHSGIRADCLGLAHFHSDGFAGWRVQASATEGLVRILPNSRDPAALMLTV